MYYSYLLHVCNVYTRTINNNQNIFVFSRIHFQNLFSMRGQWACSECAAKYAQIHTNTIPKINIDFTSSSISLVVF